MKLNGILMTLFILQGCASGTVTTTTPQTEPSATTPVTTPVTTPGTAPGTTTAGEEPEVNYAILPTVPEKLQGSFEMYKKTRSYYFDGDSKILMIFMGERSTGGYTISLREIDATDGQLHVVVHEQSPQPNDNVSQAFTYPTLILQLEESFQGFNIQDTTGKVYDPVSLSSSSGLKNR